LKGGRNLIGAQLIEQLMGVLFGFDRVSGHYVLLARRASTVKPSSETTCHMHALCSIPLRNSATARSFASVAGWSPKALAKARGTSFERHTDGGDLRVRPLIETCASLLGIGLHDRDFRLRPSETFCPHRAALEVGSQAVRKA
jgi:hypothetical protein